ncbi:disease resistance protein RPP13-like protein [Tanacetum coccineum]
MVTIYGMGGLGKTTLAKNIYDTIGGIKQFDVQAWVSFPKTSDTQTLYISILKSLQKVAKKNRLGDWPEIKDSNGDLAGYIRKFLKHRRYLVVIDNVCQLDAWKFLETAFEENNNGSRLIITTRIKGVAEQDKNFVHHELRFLTTEESWNLFCKKSSLKKNVLSPSKEILAKEMLQKCGGLPLAVVVLAEILSKERVPEAWYEVKDHIWEKLKSTSTDIDGIFSLSYNHLAEELQCCLLYMAMFPENFQFDVEKLKNLWMAEGFASHTVAAETFVQELINNSLVQVSGTLWGNVAKFRLHGLVRYLSIDKAMDVNFCGIFDPFVYHSVTLSQKRHAIHGSLQKYISVSHKETNVRSLLFFKGYREYFTEIDQLCAKLMIYRKLVVLDLMGINLSSKNKLLDVMLGKMDHLKFLGLANTLVREIPSTITLLTMLQTLEVGGKYRCILPKRLSNLKKLRHLLGRFEGPLPIEGLELHTLKAVDSDQLHAINSCKNIKELAVFNQKDECTLDFINCATVETLTVISSHDSVPLLTNIEKCSSLERLWLHGTLKETQKWCNFSSSLRSLILSNSRLSHDPMRTLGKLPCLNNLELKNSYIGKKIVCHQNEFLQLEVLRLCELYELDEWVVEEGAMPKLRGLGIFECYKLQKPNNLTCIPEVPESEADYYLQKIISGSIST